MQGREEPLLSATNVAGRQVDEIAAIGSGRNDAGSPMNVGASLRTRSGNLATFALSYTAQQHSTDFLVICDRDTYLYAGGFLSSQTGLRQAFDESVEFSKAVEQQDAAFVHAIDEGSGLHPSPADLMETYRTLEKVSSEILANGP